jgi:hypothetical protein
LHAFQLRRRVDRASSAFKRCRARQTAAAAAPPPPAVAPRAVPTSSGSSRT